jgi:hypothetical protein
MPFLRPISDRYFEDYVEGDVHRFGTIAVGADEIVAFAKQFDPQTLHTDSEAAKSGPFGGLIASGWHTAGLMTRLFMEHYLTKVASLGSPGGDELRWIKPVRLEAGEMHLRSIGTDGVMHGVTESRISHFRRTIKNYQSILDALEKSKLL